MRAGTGHEGTEAVDGAAASTTVDCINSGALTIIRSLVPFPVGEVREIEEGSGCEATRAATRCMKATMLGASAAHRASSGDPQTNVGGDALEMVGDIVPNTWVTAEIHCTHRLDLVVDNDLPLLLLLFIYFFTGYCHCCCCC